MPFDLSTAQPAQPQSSGGFDLSTAQPIQQQEQPKTLLERFKANQQARQTESLKQTLADESWLGRNLAGIGSAAAKTYYGGKQLLQGGTLSPEDQSAVKDWSTIESAAPVGAIAGNVGMLALPGAALSKVPLAAGVGKAILTPATALQAAGVGAGYSALQPTEQQGIEGLKQRGIEALKGGAAGVAGYGLAKGAGRLLSPKNTVTPVSGILTPDDFAKGDVAGLVHKSSSATPEELARIKTLKSLPVPINDEDVLRSQITRLYPQQEAERLIAGQSIIGSDLAARLEKGQAKMLDNLDILAKRTGATAPTKEQAGETVRSWMQNIYGAAKTDTRNAYEYAKQLHGDKIYKPEQGLVDSLVDNQAMPGYKELFNQAKNMGIITTNKTGDKVIAGKVTVNDLDKFKSLANQLTQSQDGMTQYAGRDIVNKVYSQLDNVAPEFREAAKLRARQGAMFETPSVTQKILGTKSGALGSVEKEAGGITIPNYKVGSEKLIDTVTNSNINDLRYIRDLALTGTKEQKTQGIQSIREMRGSVVDGMRDVWDKTVTPLAKANQLNKYLDKLGDEKIELLFGKAGSKQIKNFRDAADIMNKSVPSPEGGSQTAGRLMNMASSTFKLLEKFPIVGAPVAKAINIAKDVSVASAAKKIPKEVYYSPTRIKIGNKLSELAPYGALAGIGAAQ